MENKMTNFKIIKSQQFEFSTDYLVEYKKKQYWCFFNGGLAKLHGLRLSESLRCELSDTIEDYFLQTKTKIYTVRYCPTQHTFEEQFFDKKEATKFIDELVKMNNREQKLIGDMSVEELKAYKETIIEKIETHLPELCDDIDEVIAMKKKDY